MDYLKSVPPPQDAEDVEAQTARPERMEVDASLVVPVAEPVGSEAEPGIGPRAADGEEGSPPLPAPPAPSVPHDPALPRTSSPQLESLPITALTASVERFARQNVGGK